jgi:RHS repeat-associated protein
VRRGETAPTTVQTLYAFTGREYDAETQMQYHRARYYDPQIGRWIGQDPIGFDAGDSNLYRYVRNHPVVALDPSGKDELSDYVETQKRKYRQTDGKDIGRILALVWKNLPADKRNLVAIVDLPSLPLSVHPGPINLTELEKLKKTPGIVIQADDPGNLIKYHPGAASGFRIYDKKKDPAAGNQVTYDSKGNLITHGPAAGTPDLVSPVDLTKVLDHVLWDVEPFKAMGWAKYHKAGWAPVNDPKAPENWGELPKK